MGYQPYRLKDLSQHYDSDVAMDIAKMAKPLEVPLQSNIFEESEPTIILTFHAAIQMACYTNGIHDVAVMWLFDVF